MKRFWTAVTLAEGGADGWTLRLDGRTVHTPERRVLALPTAPLADAVAAEWAAVARDVDPTAMPLTGLANAAIDRIGPHREAFVADLGAYADSDLLCYRAEGPADLVARQAAAWDPLLDAAARRYDVTFRCVSGLIHQPQPPATCARLRAALSACDDWTMAGLATLIPLTGSLVASLALVAAPDAIADIWTAVTLDERYQAEHWGADAEAAAALAQREATAATAARFLALLRRH